MTRRPDARTASISSSAEPQAGGSSSGPAGPSRRTTACTWTAARFWYSGTGANGIGEVLAAEEAGAHQVVGVSCVEAGAGGADGGAAVAAADEEAFAGVMAGVVVVEDLAGCAVQRCGGAGQVDGVGAPAGC